MPDPAASNLDKWLDRASKIAGVLLPVIVAAVGGFYTANKDTNDRLTREAQAQRDEYQQRWDNTQKQYANMTALVPLLTSHDRSAIDTGLDIYTSEANAGQAPLDLRLTIERIKSDQPNHASAAQEALEALRGQMARACQQDPDGLYVEVQNSSDQLKRGKQLSQLLTDSQVIPVQGVQRVDSSPKHTQLRYYFSETNTAQAQRIKVELAKHGFLRIDDQDLSPRYLKKGCLPPGIYELWVGSDTPLSVDGSGTG